MNDEIKKKIIQERLHNTSRAYHHPSFLLEQRLLRAITTADREIASATLDQINRLERASLADHPLRSVQNSLIASCTIFTRACIAGGVDSETSFLLSDLYIRQIEKVNSLMQAESLEYDMLLDFIDLVSERHAPKYSPPVRKAYQYIREHIQERLTLSDVAAHVRVHPNYLCHLFKSEAKQSLMQFYDHERCAAIQQFLSLTDISLTEISIQFDFSSISYFSSYFKKHTGLTPSEYRKQTQSV